jgi:hypothetical protein
VHRAHRQEEGQESERRVGMADVMIEEEHQADEEAGGPRAGGGWMAVDHDSGNC